MLQNCVICRTLFKGDADNLHNFRKLTSTTFAVFCKYLLPDSADQINFKEVPKFCLSCSHSYLTRLHARQIKLKKLQARNASTAGQILRQPNGPKLDERAPQTAVDFPKSDTAISQSQDIEVAGERSHPPTASMCGSERPKPMSSSSSEAHQEPFLLINRTNLCIVTFNMKNSLWDISAIHVTSEASNVNSQFSPISIGPILIHWWNQLPSLWITTAFLSRNFHQGLDSNVACATFR